MHPLLMHPPAHQADRLSDRLYAKKAKGSAKDGSKDTSRQQPSTSAASSPPGAGGPPYDPRAMSHANRFSAYARDVLYRELLLKANPRRWTDVPQLGSVTLTIGLADTRVERPTADKWELLLHLLALEHVAGARGTFVEAAPGQHSGKVAGVTVTLDGDAMWRFYEKLLYLVLPTQIGFDGVAGPPASSLRDPRRQDRGQPTRTVTLRVSNLLLFPDYEHNFDLFEPLRGMAVSLHVEHATNPNLVMMLLSGLQLPLAERGAGGGGGGEGAGAGYQQGRGVGGG